MLRSVYAEESNPEYHRYSSGRYENHIKGLQTIYQKSHNFINNSKDEIEKKFKHDAMYKQQGQIENTFTNELNQNYRKVGRENNRMMHKLRKVHLRDTQHSFNKLTNPENKTDSQ